MLPQEENYKKDRRRWKSSRRVHEWRNEIREIFTTNKSYMTHMNIQQHNISEMFVDVEWEKNSKAKKERKKNFSHSSEWRSEMKN